MISPEFIHRLMLKTIHFWMSTSSFGLKRSVKQWKLLSPIIFGAVLACAIMAGTSIYFDSLRGQALRHQLNQRTPAEFDVLTTAPVRKVSREDYAKVENLTLSGVNTYLPWIVKNIIPTGKTRTFYLDTKGVYKNTPGKTQNLPVNNANQEVDERPKSIDQGFAIIPLPPRMPTTYHTIVISPNNDPHKSISVTMRDNEERAFFAFATELDKYTHLVPGSYTPSEYALNNPPDPLRIEVIVPEDAAQLLGVTIGDVLSIFPYWEEDIQHAEVVIAGIFQINDQAHEFQYVYDEAMISDTSVTVKALPLFVSKKTFLTLVGGSFENLRGKYNWLLDIDTDHLNQDNASKAIADINAMYSNTANSIKAFHISSSILPAIERYDKRLLFTKVPIFVFLIMITIVALYYLGILSSLLIDGQQSEMALLRSRGASTQQILSLYSIQGIIVSILSIALGPLLAAIAISSLGFTSAFSDLSMSGPLPVRITTGSYLMSGIGGFCTFIIMLIPAIQSSRVNTTLHRQEASRPPTVNTFQKYYLDVVFLIISVFLFNQLAQQGSMLGTNLVGEVAMNRVLLAVPAFILIALAMILLRLLPILLKILSRVLSQWLSVGLVIALWHMARNPTHYARLSLLLILVGGLGIFSSSFVTTLETNFRERVLYETGGEIRVSGISTQTGVSSKVLTTAYLNNPKITDATPFFRSIAFDSTKISNDPFTVLAIQPESFTRVAWTRDDFFSEPLEKLFASLEISNDKALPVLASRSFLETMQYPLGMVINIDIAGYTIPVELVKSIDLFPTLFPDSKPFLVTNLESLRSFSGTQGVNSGIRPNEVWMSTDSVGSERTELIKTLYTTPFVSEFIRDRESLLHDTQVDPLAKAGWTALLFIAFSTVLILSGVGFLVHSYISFKQREKQFSLLRTLGFSMNQLATVVALEHILVICIGMALGTWMGARITSIIMPFLGHDALGYAIVPPFTMEISWGFLWATYGAMAALLTIITATIVIFIRTTSLQRMLRLGDI